MKLAICYVFPNTAEAQRPELAARFVTSYAANGPGMDHESIVVLNGSSGGGNGFAQALFAALPNLRILQHDNSGWDIGAFQKAAREVPCDLMVFFGATAWFPKANWLQRVYQASQRRGLAIYGSHGNQGDHNVSTWPHVRTTGWWLNPGLLSRYPMVVTQPQQRYPFEHGPTCLCQWAKSQGIPTWVVGWDGEYAVEVCDGMPNGFHKGDQSNLLFMDRLTSPPYYG
jgi:hypothetical protein